MNLQCPKCIHKLYFILLYMQCWETYIGQQIYKLVVLDFLVAVIVVFFVEFPRRHVLIFIIFPHLCSE